MKFASFSCRLVVENDNSMKFDIFNEKFLKFFHIFVHFHLQTRVGS